MTLKEAYSGLPASNSPTRVELPPKLVGVKAVPNMVAGADGSLVNSGKVEVRLTSPATKGPDKRVDWQSTAYRAGHEALYAYQYARDQDIRIEELERNYSQGRMRYDEAMRELIVTKAKLNGAFMLRDHWAWFLLPLKVKRILFPMDYL